MYFITLLLKCHKIQCHTMKTKLNFRSVVFKRAYILVKQTGCSFSSALKAAWNRYREYKSKTVQELTSQINGFDFYYQYCDDGSVYRYWSSLKDELRKQLGTLPQSFISALKGQLSKPNNIYSFI